MMPPTAPSAASDDDDTGGGRSLSVATSRAGLGSDGGRGGTAPPSVDGVVIDRFEGEEDGKPASSTTHQRRGPSSVVPPLPLGKPEVAPSSASPPAAVRRKNSFVAKLVASWQFAQRKRLRRQGKTREREFFLSDAVSVFSLSNPRSPPFPLSSFSLFLTPRAPTVSHTKNTKTSNRRARLSGLRNLGAALLCE